jgi:hypothetical protein
MRFFRQAALALFVTLAVLGSTRSALALGNQLDTDQVLGPGESLATDDGRYQLIMQSDGNLVLYDTSVSPWNPQWNSGTATKDTSFAVMQGDGNLVVYRISDGKPTWSSGTWGRGPSFLVLSCPPSTRPPMSIITNETYVETWSFSPGPPAPPQRPGPTQSDGLHSGQVLVPGASITSDDGHSLLVMQGDGNLVLYDTSANPWRPLWASNTATGDSSYLINQGDGNLVVYRLADGQPTWSSGTAGTGPSFLSMNIAPNPGDAIMVLVSIGGPDAGLVTWDFPAQQFANSLPH